MIVPFMHQPSEVQNSIVFTNLWKMYYLGLFWTVAKLNLKTTAVGGLIFNITIQYCVL